MALTPLSTFNFIKIPNYNSEVQCGHFFAFILISEQQKGQVLTVGAAASFSQAVFSAAAFNLLMNLTNKNTANATNIKLINELIKSP